MLLYLSIGYVVTAPSFAFISRNVSQWWHFILTHQNELQLFILNKFHVLSKKVTIHQVTTILATSKNVLFPGHNHLLTTSTDDLTLTITECQWVKGHQYQWLGGYDLEIGYF